ncbi:MAG TPA: hypothetical protein PLE19_10120 [Planctomycetota bacterium]|nr:hypothetical protein [Planctomycetota bacterium]HRR82982.1 hypothetical protein [Planctomycetota bacterium]HRT97020.1 hypothetical protein [Planctomycetota bacterium]
MPPERPEIERYAPDKLLLGFSKTRVAQCFAIAIAIHLVAAAATSVGYIRDHWIDPEGAARRRAEQIEARKAEDIKASAPAPERPPAPKPGAARQDEPKARDAASTDDEARKKSPVMKEITDLPKKGEIPKQPDDLGLSIDETNK